MGNKNKLISKVMFFVSLALFFIFAITTFFGGQKIAGAIYFIFFAMSVAFACVDKKYSSNYFEFYRYSIYLDDLINILAVSTMIYYKHDSLFMIGVLCLVGVGLFVDLLCQNRLGKRRFASVVASVLNCALMLVIFPYFFITKMPLVMPILAVVVAFVVSVLKVFLAVGPLKNESNEPVVLKEENNVLVVESDKDVE